MYPVGRQVIVSMKVFRSASWLPLGKSDSSCLLPDSRFDSSCRYVMHQTLGGPSVELVATCRVRQHKAWNVLEFAFASWFSGIF